MENNIYYIYILENDAHLIKIGITQNFNNRLISLSGSNGGGHKIINQFVSEPTYMRSLERVMHIHFSKYRIKGTEWFKDLTFSEAVNKLEEYFNSKSYQTANNLRKQYSVNTVSPDNLSLT